MLKNYLLLVGLSGLLLVGCGRSERPAETTTAPQLPAAAPPTAVAPATTPADPAPATAATRTGAAESMTLLMRPDVVGPAVGPLAESATPPGRRLTRRPASPGRRLVGASSGRGQSEPLTAVSVPDSVRTAELREFLRAGLPAAQTFTIRPDRDTLLVGTQGTQVLLPADALDLADATAVVRLELQEFYTPADMVLAGLSTQAGSRLLETGGMLYVAATANGQPVALRPGRQVQLRLPARQVQSDMQLFEGVAHGTGRPLDWELPAERDTRAGRVRAARRVGFSLLARRDSLAKPRVQMQWPVYNYFENDLQAQFKLPLSPHRRLHRSVASPASTRQQLDALSDRYHHRIVRLITLQFVVDSVGTLGSVVAMPGSDPGLTPAAVAALQQLSHWQPAALPSFYQAMPCNEHAAVRGQLYLAVSKTGQVHLGGVHWELLRTARPHARRLRHTVDSLLAQPDFRRRYWRAQDSLAYARMSEAQRRMRTAQDRLRTQFTDTSRADLTQDGVFNELRAQGFGWINCDRFNQAPSLFTYEVPTSRPNTIVSLLFKNPRSVLYGDFASGDRATFNNVPKGYPATVVALRRENGVTYLARHEVRLGQDPPPSLKFKPVTMAQLRAELKP